MAITSRLSPTGKGRCPLTIDVRSRQAQQMPWRDGAMINCKNYVGKHDVPLYLPLLPTKFRSPDSAEYTGQKDGCSLPKCFPCSKFYHMNLMVLS
jgi:hypothetical protein